MIRMQRRGNPCALQGEFKLGRHCATWYGTSSKKESCQKIQQFHFWHISRGNKVAISEKCQHAHAHSSVVYNGGDAEIARESSDACVGKKQHRGIPLSRRKEESRRAQQRGGAVRALCQAKQVRARETDTA